jgi:hypothetical protein
MKTNQPIFRHRHIQDGILAVLIKYNRRQFLLPLRTATHLSPPTGGLPPRSLSLRKVNHSVPPSLPQTVTVPHRFIRPRPVLVALRVAGNYPCAHPLTGRRRLLLAESRRAQRAPIQGKSRAGGKIQMTRSIRSMLVHL